MFLQKRRKRCGKKTLFTGKQDRANESFFLYLRAISQNASLKALHQSMQNTRPIEKSNGSNTESQPVSSTLQKPEDKPAVGSEEWHKQRRENHKQVERRRRETINDGINEIARIVPGCEKNKGSILNRAAAYIRQLKETEAASVEKWSLEKLLTDQAISELNRQIEAYKAKLEQVELQNNYLKRELNAVTEMSENKKAKLEHTTES